MEDGGELITFIKVWSIAIISICYCYFISNRIRDGFRRLLSILPVIIVFLILPIPLSTVHLGGTTIFYLVWLGNFKLLLFAFNRGPLASTPRLPFLMFISIALLPINPKDTRRKVSDPDLNLTTGQDPDMIFVTTHKPIRWTIKVLILALIVSAYQYKDKMHQNVILGLKCCNVYIGVELVLALTAFCVRFLLRLDFEIEPQFNEPYLSTSLQDFWGRRWNLMVTKILRPSVYDPVREVSLPVLGKLRSQMLAMLATFIVSGLMHELIFSYVTRVRPTWEVTWFFVLHGVCTTAEVAVKKAINGRFRLHRVLSVVVTVAFVAVTGVWLFMPQLFRSGYDVKAVNEYLLVVKFIRSKLE